MGMFDGPPPSNGGLFDGPPPQQPPPERSITGTGVLAPITTLPSTYKEMQRDSGEQLERGFKQLYEGKSPEDTGPAGEWNSPSSLWARTKGLGNVAFGALGGFGGNVIGAPIRTFWGKPIENLTGIPKEYPEFIGALAFPGVGMTRVPRLPAHVQGVPKSPVTGGLSAEARANAELADEFGIRLSRGQAEQDATAIRMEDTAARGAYGKPAQDVAQPFFENQFGQIHQAGRDVGEQLARGTQFAESPSAAAATVAGEVGDRARLAREMVEVANQRAEQAAAAQRVGLERQGRTLTEGFAGGHAPIANTREAGEVVGQAIRERAAAERAAASRQYDEAFALPGQFHAGALEGVGNRIQSGLSFHRDPVIIDDVTTPIASRAVRDLDNISNLRIQNRADPFGAPNPDNIVAVDLRGVDQARKRLVAYYQAARRSGNAADARAAGRVIDEFDNQIERAISNGLFSGDERALGALQRARASYSNYARTYRPQGAGDDVGLAMRRIIDRNATPEEVANMVVGSGRLGNAGLPVRLADRLETIFGANSQEWSAVKQALWQRASNPRTATGAIDPARAAQSIIDFAGSSLARRVFSPQDLVAMRAHARGIRDLDQTIANLPETAVAERARNIYQRAFSGEGIGGAQATAFRRIIEGTATPEEAAHAVFGAIGSSNPGNVQRMIAAIERIAGANSETMGAIRQGVWQKLTQNAAGKDQPGQQKLAQAINEFLNGKGAGIAKQLYTTQERALMQKYADAVKLTVINKYARTNSDTAIAASAMEKYAGAITTALSYAVGAVAGHGVIGRLANSATERVLSRPIESLSNRNITDKLRRQFEYRNGGRVKGYADGGDIGPFVPLEREPEVNIGRVGGLSKGSIDAAKRAGHAVYEDLAAPGQAIGDAVSRIGSAASPGFVDFATPVAAAAMNVAPGPRMQRAGLKAAEAAAPKVAEWATPKVEPIGIRAFHASPYNFDRFDMSKVGTGQGAQSYGHGIYAAGHESVSGRPGSAYWEDFARQIPANTAEGRAVNLWREAGFDRGKAARVAEKEAAKFEEFTKGEGVKFDLMGPREMKMWEHQVNNWNKLAAEQREVANLLRSKQHIGPYTYEVAIKADPEHFLHWDKPLSEQPPHVDAALQTILKDRSRMPADWIKSSPGAESSMREAGIPGIKYLDQGSRFMPDPYRGNPAYLHAAQSFKDAGKTSRQAIEGLMETYKGANPDTITKAVAEAYGLRKDPTHNYVVFDDKLLSILNKYRLGGTVPYFMRAHGGGVKGYADGGSPFSSPADETAVLDEYLRSREAPGMTHQVGDPRSAWEIASTRNPIAAHLVGMPGRMAKEVLRAPSHLFAPPPQPETDDRGMMDEAQFARWQQRLRNWDDERIGAAGTIGGFATGAAYARPGNVGSLGAGGSRMKVPPGAPETPFSLSPRSTADLPNLRELPVDEAVAIARGEPHLKLQNKDASEGLYVGGPRDIKSYEDLVALRKRMDDYIAADPFGWSWYDRYRPAIAEMTGNVPRDNLWAARQHGEFSSGRPPLNEIQFVLKENNAALAGMPTSANYPAQHQNFMRAIEMNDPYQMARGRKTDQYASQINPTNPANSFPRATSVNDGRYQQLFEYRDPQGNLASPGDEGFQVKGQAPHNFMDYETALMVDRANKAQLGGRSDWTGERLQAAPWVRQKALGIIEQAKKNPPTYEVAREEANKTIADYLDKHTLNAPHELTPGADTRHLRGLLNASPKEKAEFAQKLSWAFAPLGRDALYAGTRLGDTGVAMRVRPTIDAQGVYTPPGGVTEYNPAQVARPLVAFDALSGGNKTVAAADKKIIDAVESFRAYGDVQNAGASNKLWDVQRASDANSLFWPMEGKATPEQLQAVQASSGRFGLPDVSDAGRGIVNTSWWPTPTAKTGKDVGAALKRGDLDNVIPGVEPRRVKVEGQLHPAATNGDGYVSAWRQPEGSGQATRLMIDAVSATPELRAAFNQNPYIPQAFVNRLAVHGDAAGKYGGVRQDVMNAFKILSEGPNGIDRLDAALKAGTVSLPAVVGAFLMKRQIEDTGGL